MNWMDDGEKSKTSKVIQFEPLELDGNVSLTRAIKLSVEKRGYKKEITKKKDKTTIWINIPFLIQGKEDGVFVNIYKDMYYVNVYVDIETPKSLDEKIDILEYVNSKRGFVSIAYNDKEGNHKLGIEISNRRLDTIDKELERRLIDQHLFGLMKNNDDHDYDDYDDWNSNSNPLNWMMNLKERIEAYQEENLEFNLSGNWNATSGFEYKYILDDINHLIDVVQEERENILRFT